MSGISSQNNNRFQPVIVFLSFLAICAGGAQLSIRHSPESAAIALPVNAVPANPTKTEGPFFLIKVQVVEVPVNLLSTLDIKPFDKTKMNIKPKQVEKLFSTQLESLRKNKKVKVLAEPTLCIADGHRASFFSGGEIPVAVFLEDGTTLEEFIEIGLRVGVMAKLQENGRINFGFSPEIRNVDFNKTVMLNGKPLPSLHSQRVNTGVEMKYGETVVLSNFTATPLKDKTTHQILFVAKVEKFEPL